MEYIDSYLTMAKISVQARQRLEHMILEDIGNGLMDYQIMDKRSIPSSTFYKYKKELGKQCLEIISKKTYEDIAMATVQMEQCITRYLQWLEPRLQLQLDSNNNSTKDCCRPEYYVIAFNLAYNRCMLKIKGGHILGSWRSNNNNGLGKLSKLRMLSTPLAAATAARGDDNNGDFDLGGGEGQGEVLVPRPW
jgi:hypothetical protein